MTLSIPGDSAWKVRTAHKPGGLWSALQRPSPGQAFGLGQEEQAAPLGVEPLLRAAAGGRFPSLAAGADGITDFEERFRHGVELIVQGRGSGGRRRPR
ncbi:hypothetical protein SAZ11_10175 [Streptomyces sp. FXJ1.4098]|nr:hypothetical protein [Streptomyces sp. FXJ1.4098]